MEDFLKIGLAVAGGILSSYLVMNWKLATVTQSLKDAHARLTKVEEKQDRQIERVHDQLNHLQEAVAGIESILKIKFK